MAQLSWDWLEGYPALDLANTVKRSAWQERELLHTPADLDSWLDHAALPAPRPPTVGVDELAAVLALRDPSLRLLHARLGRGPWRSGDVTTINTYLVEGPDLLLLGPNPESPLRRTLGPQSALAVLLARLAAGVRDALQRTDLAFCDAPGCGLLFYRHRNNQTWCGPPCGNRARVARHQPTA